MRPTSEELNTDTIVKLYEYALPGSTKTMATADFYRALSNKLWTVVVPIRIHETRVYKGHTLESTFSGMNIRLEDDKGDVLEEGFPGSLALKYSEGRAGRRAYLSVQERRGNLTLGQFQRGDRLHH